MPRVPGPPEKLQQVYINILTNASQVMPEGGTIVTETGYVQSESPWVYARISDTGKGIAEVNLARIFDPFWTTKENWQSPGLGLSVARRIVDEHRGQIQVESKEGQGSTFKILLPPVTLAAAPA
jgi:two-component system NtrC family sensor kinase